MSYNNADKITLLLKNKQKKNNIKHATNNNKNKNIKCATVKWAAGFIIYHVVCVC